MKTIFLMTTITMLSSFTTVPAREEISSSSALGDRLVRCFQHQSAEEFSALLPTLDEFHQIMEENSAIYGENLEEAKRDFDIHYNENIVRSARASFDKVLQDGSGRGIDWKAITFLKAQVEGPSNSFSSPLLITFASRGEVYKLRLRPAIVFHNHWRVTQHLELL